ncbi:hypothetical protein GCM10022389_24010 [Flavobacterium cheonanense]|uniref:Uncharacterized protein n=1 Tax=Flavobacterium cheonanense TaxID=706183 RepID=A0ABP7W1C6_9FLAO
MLERYNENNAPVINAKPIKAKISAVIDGFFFIPINWLKLRFSDYTKILIEKESILDKKISS